MKPCQLTASLPGIVGHWDVFSFVTAQGDVKSFSGDLKLFISTSTHVSVLSSRDPDMRWPADYLTNAKKFSTDLLLTTVQAGTEPFQGGATLKVRLACTSCAPAALANDALSSQTSAYVVPSLSSVNVADTSFSPSATRSSLPSRGDRNSIARARCDDDVDFG